LEEQQKSLNLPILPTTTIGSFPQTPELRRVRREVKSKKISEEEYDKAIKAEIDNVVKLQEGLDIDVLVHGEPEVRIPGGVLVCDIGQLKVSFL
jgi:5-methyltetrahydropteroyltriglutamate--homocysteine methyltransferase